jgi:hypothetical protein
MPGQQSQPEERQDIQHARTGTNLRLRGWQMIKSRIDYFHREHGIEGTRPNSEDRT